jgi:hypothetical protein
VRCPGREFHLWQRIRISAAAHGGLHPNGRRRYCRAIGRKLSWCPTGWSGLWTQPVDATFFILIVRGLKPKAFLWRGPARTRDCAGTSDNGQGIAPFAISADLTSTCCCAC